MLNPKKWLPEFHFKTWLWCVWEDEFAQALKIAFLSSQCCFEISNLQFLAEINQGFLGPDISVIQCWFKLTGQNEQILKIQTRFSQIVLRLDKKWREQKLLKNSPELYGAIFSPEFSTKISPKKWEFFVFFQLTKNYAETILLIDEKYISQEVSYTVQKNSRKVDSPKISVNCLKTFEVKIFGFI